MASEYLSTKQIADKLNLPKQKVYRCIKLNHIKEAHTETVKGNTVLMYDKQGKLLKKFQSAREAARYLGSESKNVGINYCLNNKQKTAYGYVWKYDKD